MPLKHAAASYSQNQWTYNPIWKHISNRWYDWLMATADSDTFMPGLYVPNSGKTGATVDDLVAYLEGDQARLCVLRGPGGVGKTTFLVHATRTRLTTSRFEILYCNGLAWEFSSDAKAILRKIGNHLQTRIDRSEQAPRWPTFWLSHVPGVTHQAILQMMEEAPARPETLGMLATAAREASHDHIQEWIAAQCAFVRTELQRVPVIIIDNIDQLPTSILGAILDAGRQICIGTHADVADEADAVIARHGVARVVVAMRPVTVAQTRPYVTTVRLLRVEPPELGKVLRRRIEAFFREQQDSGLPRKIPATDVLTKPQFSGTDIALLLEEDLPDLAFCTRFLDAMIDALIEEDKPTNIAQELYRANNGNLRASLLAAARFVMSGHFDLDDLAGAMTKRRPLSEFKVFKSLLLGTQTLFDERDGWALNLLNDGHTDQTALLLRLRMLKLVAARGGNHGMALNSIVDFLNLVFNYDMQRSSSVFSVFLERGLLSEDHDERFRLTDTGRVYLSSLFRNFEYVQHIAVRVWVPSQYCVPCLTSVEDAYTRFHRVAQIASWCRECEVEDLRKLNRSERRSDYDEVYGQDLVSHTIARTLQDAARRLPRRGRVDFEQTAKNLAEWTKFEVVSRAASEAHQ